MTEHILKTQQDRIQKIQFNRPEKKNALTQAMYRTLAEALQEADQDEMVRAIFITGSADSFSSGNDVMDFLAGATTDEVSPALQFLRTISHIRKPIVAAVNGLAIGIGTTMLLHCDLVYAADTARFQLPFVNLGLVPEAGSSFLLPSLAGYRQATELFLLGEFFDAQKAKQLDLVNAVCPAAELEHKAWQKAQALAAQPPSALCLTKSLLKKSQAEIVQATMTEESGHFAERLQSAEAREALQAFMERRKPDFSKFT